MAASAEGRDLTEMSGLETELAKLGADGAMDVLCRSVTAVIRGAPRVPSRVGVKFGCASIEVEWPAAETGGVRATEVPPDPDEPAGAPDRHTVRAPLVGTFYRAPEPGAKPFVEVGDLIEIGQQVAIVEAMKLMNPIVADRAGRVAEILAGDTEAVEYDQPLLLLEPEAAE